VKSEKRKSGWVAGTFGFLFFLPYLLIYATGLSEWFARLLATGYFLILGSAFGIFMAANMRAPMVREGSKLAQLNMPRTRAVAEWGFRGAFVLVAIMVFFSFPQYVKDIAPLSKRRPPPETEGRVTGISTFWLTALTYQSFEVTDPRGQKTKCHMVYSLFPMIRGKVT
jgi:hypothetical protein